MISQAVRVPSSELSAPVITYLTRAKYWVLEGGYSYEDREAAPPLLSVQIPSGFTFDLASIPRPLWSVIAPFELSISAPLIHDYLYRGNDPRFDRSDADRIFRTAMRHEGVSAWRRNVAYAAVRAFGGKAWRGQ